MAKQLRTVSYMVLRLVQGNELIFNDVIVHIDNDVPEIRGVVVNTQWDEVEETVHSKVRGQHPQKVIKHVFNLYSRKNIFSWETSVREINEFDLFMVMRLVDFEVDAN